MNVGAGGLEVCQELSQTGRATQQLMPTTGHVTLSGSWDLPSNPWQIQGHKFMLLGQRTEAWKGDKAAQPLRDRYGLEPRSSVSHPQASPGTKEGGGDKPWGGGGDKGSWPALLLEQAVFLRSQRAE